MNFIDIKIEDITKENSKEFGTLVTDKFSQPSYKDDSYSYFSKLAVNNFTEDVSFSIVQSYKEANGIVPTLEYHEKTVEVLIPTDDVILVLAKGDKEPDIKTAKALLLKKGDAFIINPYIWHYAPLTTDKIVNTFVIFNCNTSDSDLFKLEIKDKLRAV